MPDTPPDPDAVVPLQQWLKLLTAQGAPMRVAMAFAAKAYKDTNTVTKLKALTPAQLAALVPDKDTRKFLTNAIKGVVAGNTAPVKRRGGRDSDLLRPLGDGDAPTNVPTVFEFHEITDVEAVLPVSLTCNRAPIKTAWCYAVARRLGFDVAEALSIAHVYVHISSLKHALGLGNILDAQQTREAEEEIRELPGEHDYRKPADNSRSWRHNRDAKVEKAVGSSQPWVGILKAKIPVVERPDGTWRAIQKGAVVEPSVAFLYITRALKDYTPHVMGALQLVAESYEPHELDVVGLHLYTAFKPDVVEWGQRGSVSVADILEQIKAPVAGSPAPDTVQDETEDVHDQDKDKDKDVHSGDGDRGTKRPASDPPEAAVTDTPAKKQRDMTVEEYEAMLDAEDDSVWDQVQV